MIKLQRSIVCFVVIVFLIFSPTITTVYGKVSPFFSHNNLSYQAYPGDTESRILYQEQPSRKIAYLTFDDGPNRYTPQILNILRNADVRATFFVIGSQVAHDPELTKRMLQDGHYIGLHSMSHDVNQLYNGDPYPLVAEMEQVQHIVLTSSGLHTQLVRVPYGSKPYLTQTYRDSLADAHFKVWDWTIDTKDWNSHSTISSVLNRVSYQASRDIEVILMHDSSLTVQALPQMINILRAKGYLLLPYRPCAHVEVNFWHDGRL